MSELLFNPGFTAQFFKRVCRFACLGVVLSCSFTLSGHVEHVISKVNQRSGLLRRIEHLLPFIARPLYYKNLVLPILDYADMVWGDKDNTALVNNLQLLQNKADKFILDRPLYSSATEALSKLRTTKAFSSLPLCL